MDLETIDENQIGSNITQAESFLLERLSISDAACALYTRRVCSSCFTVLTTPRTNSFDHSGYVNMCG